MRTWVVCTTWHAGRMRLMLLDSASLYFRAFFGVPGRFRAPDGTPVNAVRGFLDMVSTLVGDHSPTHVVACWDDDWRPAWRVELLPSYKLHRVADGVAPDAAVGQSIEEEAPDDLSVQVPLIAAFLEAAGIARVGATGCEADDVIGTLATRATMPVDIVTGDRDLFQLIDDARAIRVIYPGKGGVRNPEIVDQHALSAKYGIDTGDQYAALATLRGDASDGLPGVAGIGEKTAATLISRFGSLTGLLQAAVDGDAGVTASQRAKLAAGADYLRVAPRVVNVLRDADLPAADAELPASPLDPQRLSKLGGQWGVSSSVDRLVSALARG